MDQNYELVKLYNDSNSLVRHHLNSYNHFIDVELPKIVKAHGKIELPAHKMFVEFSSIKVGLPASIRTKRPIYPQQCRLRNLNYSSDVTIDVRYTANDRMILKKNVFIGRIPIMLRSNRCHLYEKSTEERVSLGECDHDTGGYFITRGSERVFLMQEQMAKNRMIIEKQKITKKGGKKIPSWAKMVDSDIVCHVVSFTVENKSKTTVFKNNGYFYVQNNFFTESIPLFVLFAALNMPAHKDIYESIGREYDLLNELNCSAMEAISLNIFSQKQALMWLISKIKLVSNKENKMTINPSSLEEEELSLLTIKHELNRKVLNHVKGSPNNMIQRAKYLGSMVRRILLAEKGYISPDDRDFYGVKRIDLVGSYLALAFEDKFQTLISNLKMELIKILSAKKATALDPCNLIQENIITEGIHSCISSGSWVLQRFMMNRSGVTQILNRLSFIATLGHLARINSQFEKVRKISGARAIHLSQYGFVCPADTPEGEQCGLVKNLAFMVDITVDLPQAYLEQCIREVYCDDLNTFEYCSGRYVIMLNGVPMGWTNQPKECGQQLRNLRRQGYIHEHVSIYYEEEMETLHICSDSGRMVRPYIIVENGYSKLTHEIKKQVTEGLLAWRDLIKMGVIEYLDAREGYAECLLAACENDITKDHTHLDIDPATALGTVASLIPFPHHNQSPRNTYQCAMGKQALGVISSNQRKRCDGTQHVLITPHRPLTLSNVGKLIGYDKLPAGQNAIVAITCFGGHDIEDALIVNEASLNRGLFRSLTNKTFNDTLTNTDDLGVPAKKGDKTAHLDADGTPVIGELIGNGQVLIHKISTPARDPVSSNDPLKELQAEPKTCPTSYHAAEKTRVTKVMFTQEENNNMLVRVQVSQMRTPEIGDKLSSRHGQKGVIGRIVPYSEMPRTENGLVPDVIMNPHGFPSRMTVGKLLELIANKCAVIDGNVRNSSAFSSAGHKSLDDDYSTVLREHGYNVSGKEILISGHNGDIMEVDIYMGPIFYQRLRHMVQDKVHARATGKNQSLTRQPVVGRAQDGGLRIGEMERDCLIGYGATQILKERMMLSSDPYRTWVCEKCGLFASSKDWCQMCRSSQHVSSVLMPYATKLLFQELMTMQIKPRLTLTDHETNIL